jgi:hypothetical protein
MSTVGATALHHPSQQVRGELREAIQQDRGHDHEAGGDQEDQGDAAPRHAAGQGIAPPPLTDVEDEAGDDPEHARGDENPAVLHRDGHEGPAAEPEDDDGKWQQTAEGR